MGTVNSSKIVCTILRKKIEDFLKEKGIVYNNQSGFTEGGRVEHCMFMLDYIANMTYEKVHKAKHSLYFAFIDFRKAYDSIDRQKLIEVLIGYNINPLIIDLIVQMYQEDCTIIKLGKMNKKVEVTSWIRQGCCISTLLFKLVTFKIIDELRKKKYKVREFCDNSLWLADDATLIAEKLETLLELLDCLGEAGGVYGLEINKEKTKIMKIRGPENDLDIGDYEMVKEAKYLGVMLGGHGRNIFEKANDLFLINAEKQVYTLIGQIRKSADKVLVGKAIWKLMCLPSVLFGRAVVPTNKTRVEGLQRLENKVWRFLMGVGGYSTVDAVRGEMGASLVESRIMETMLLYARDAMKGSFQNIKNMMEDTMTVKKGKWYNSMKDHLRKLNISWDNLIEMPRAEIKRRVKDYDTERWRTSLQDIRTQKYYVLGKKKFGYDFCYRNNYDSTFLAKARLNALKLEEQISRGKDWYDSTCKLCRQTEENIVHFIMDCPALESIRDYDIIDRNEKSSEERMVDLLFFNGRFQEVGLMIRKLWLKRRNLLTSIKERNKQRLRRFNPH